MRLPSDLRRLGHVPTFTLIVITTLALGRRLKWR
jgi:hypothetical protein